MATFKKRAAVLTMILISLVIFCPVQAGTAFAASLTTMAASNVPDMSLAAPPLIVIEGKIGREPVYNELVARGISPSEVLTLTRSFKGVFDFRKARPKDEYQVYLTPQKELRKLTYKTSLTDQYIAVRTDDGAFRAYHREIPLKKETVVRTFTVESSLHQAFTGQGEKSQLVDAFTNIFSWDIDFYLFPRKGDIIRVLFEKYSMGGEFVKYGEILAAQYIGRKTFSAFYFDDGLQAGYYDENGAPLRKMFMRVPVSFGTQTSSYSTRRFHPISKKYKRHTGIDYRAAHGSPIMATAGGTVEFAGWRGGYGKLVIVRHPNGYQTYYGHCSRLLVKKGSTVKQGQTIARVGRTGQATGPHVHYEVRINGKPVNPYRVKTAKSDPLPSDQRTRFEEIVQARLLMLEDYLLSKMRQTAIKTANLQ